MIIITNNEEETEKLGEKIGKNLKGTEIISLWGSMGMGKTCITRGIAKAFNMDGLVSSPTFAIINEYKRDKFTIYHFDMYRIHSEDELESTGFYDYINKGIIIIEWSENIKNHIPNESIKIKIEPFENESKRKIYLEGINIK